jgi:hypothetical protein
MPRSNIHRLRALTSVLLVVVLACLGGRMAQTEDECRHGKDASFGKGAGPILSAQQVETKSAARKTSAPWIPNVVNPRGGALHPDVRPSSIRPDETAAIWLSATAHGGFRGRAPPAVS